ncbi:MAG: cation transporter [Gammaproteobacteria bacterium]|nr:MAG: cation transporter [Gammaproteobacteria bacterium]
MTEHREGVNPGFLISHKLALTGLTEANTDNIRSALDDLPGVDAVSLDKAGQSLKIAYDASHQSIDHIIQIIEQQGAGLRAGWWNRVKLNWQRQTDTNIKDNSTHEAHCCSKLPSDYKSLKK